MGDSFVKSIVMQLALLYDEGIMTGLRGCCPSSTRGSRANDVIIRPTPSGAGRTTPEQNGHYSNYIAKPVNSRYFHRKFLPHSSHWTWLPGHFVTGNLLSIVTPSVLEWLQSHGWYQIRDTNWLAGFDIHAFNSYVTHGLCLVPMSCCEWRLVWCVKFVLHAELASQ